jgi:hypothetical protein
MKPVRILSLLPFLLLSACGRSRDIETALEASAPVVQQIEPSGKAAKGYAFEGHIAQFRLVRPAKGNGGLDENSPLLGEPVHISKEGYYNPDKKTDQSGSYYAIARAMIPSADPKAQLSFALDQGNLVYSALGVSGKLSFKKVQLSEDDAYTFGEVDVSGRFDVVLTYSGEGNLLTESVKTSGSLHAGEEASVSYTLTYSYAG